MRQVILMLCLILLIASAKTQPTFEKAIIDPIGRNLPTAVVEHEGGYLICAWGNEPNVGGWKAIRLYKTDSIGNVLWQKYIGKENFGYSPGDNGSFNQIPDGSFIIGGHFINSNQTAAQALLIKLNSQGDTLWTKSYGRPQTYDWIRQARQTPDGGFVLFGETNAFDAKNDYYLIKTDSAGNFQWEKTYGDFGYYESGVNIETTKDGGFILGGQKGANSVDNADAYFIKTDSAGNIQWEKVYGTQGDDRIRNITTSKDREFFIWGGGDTLISNTETQWAEFVAKLDSAGNIMWRTFLDKQKYHNIWQVRELQDGSIVFIGEAVYQGNVEDAGWIGKLDVDGNVLWERFHIYPQKPFFVRDAIFASDFQQTTDGGFIVAGNIWRQQDTTQPSVYTQHIWLVKLDSLGCLNGDCGITVGVEELPQVTQNEAQIVVYPNPLRYSALVSIRANQHPNKEVVFQLYDVTGKIIRSQKQLLNGYGYGEFQMQRDNLPQGVYFYTVSGRAGELGRGKVVVQ